MAISKTSLPITLVFIDGEPVARVSGFPPVASGRAALRSHPPEEDCDQAGSSGCIFFDDYPGGDRLPFPAPGRRRS